ncbi:MAG: hypothetical protein R3F05_16740 [Planctomycetota bacterium]
MRTRRQTSVVVVIALAVGGLWLSRSEPPSARDVPVRKQGVDAGAECTTTGPSLVGRAVERTPGEAVEASPAPAQIDPAAKDAAGEESELRAVALVQAIQRDVEPAWWSGDPDVYVPVIQNGILIVRAPGPILESVGAYVERLRGGLLRPARAAPGDARRMAAARDEARSLMRGILAREQVLVRALRAWDEGDVQTAHRDATAVLQDEPDNRLAEDMLRGLDAEAGGTLASDLQQARAVLRDRLDLRRRERWLTYWVVRWPSATTRRALLAVRAPGDSRGAPDLRAVLEQGDVGLLVDDECLLDVVRRLQIESGAAVSIPASLHDEADDIRVRGLNEPSRSLRYVLDEVVRRLPAGWAWRVEYEQIVIGRFDHDGLVEVATRLRYFDVRDLLGMEPPDTSGDRRSEPPPCRTYTSDEVGAK